MTLLDGAWLILIAPAFYQKHIGFILADTPNRLAAIAFYVIYILGVTVFVVYPGWHHLDSLVSIGLRGALFGFVTYATYDLTNQATLKDWPRIVTVVDMVWGTVLVSSVSVVAVSILRVLVS